MAFFGTTVKDKQTILVVGIDMEAETLILVQLKSIVILVATTLNPSIEPKDVGIDVKVEVIEATWLWKSNVGNIDYKYEDIIPIKKGVWC